MTARVAVVVPSLNSPLIAEVAAAVAAQDGVACVSELRVVGRDEARLLRARELPGGGRVRLIDTRVPVSEPAARNLGLEGLDCDLVIFLDSDCLPQPGWLQAHVAAHAGAPRLVCGGVRATGESYWSLVYNLSLFYAFLDVAPAGARPALPTLNLSFPRALAERVGRFDERLARATDVDWTLRARRAGIALHFDPAPVVEHRHARHALRAVWSDCAGSGFHARRVRLRHADVIAAPRLLRHPPLVRALAPLMATWVTVAVLARWRATFRRRWHSLPGFWVTKLAWAWGAGGRPR